MKPITIATPRRLAFGRKLRAWYRANARDLPWRRTRDPYHILVSELMLQQTQVLRVVPKYSEFLARFPTLESVARSRPSRVMEAWSGLGYYARARNLQRLARTLARPGASAVLPSEPAELRALPGIGAYTAGAVASFAYERRAPLVDTNVARVLTPRVRAAHRSAHARGAPDRVEDRERGAASHRTHGVHAQPGPHGARRARLHGARARLPRVPGPYGVRGSRVLVE